MPDGKGLQYFNKFKDVEVNAEGNGIMDVFGSVANFVKDNKETISSVADVAGKVASAASNVVGVAKSIEEVKAIRRKALENAKKGNALYLPDDKDGSSISLSTPIIGSGKDSEVAKRIKKMGNGFKLLNPS